MFLRPYSYQCVDLSPEILICIYESRCTYIYYFYLFHLPPFYIYLSPLHCYPRQVLITSTYTRRYEGTTQLLDYQTFVCQKQIPLPGQGITRQSKCSCLCNRSPQPHLRHNYRSFGVYVYQAVMRSPNARASAKESSAASASSVGIAIIALDVCHLIYCRGIIIWLATKYPLSPQRTPLLPTLPRNLILVGTPIPRGRPRSHRPL